MADLSFTTKPVTGAPVAADRFHNIPNERLADQIGELDCQVKAAEAGSSKLQPENTPGEDESIPEQEDNPKKK